MNSFLVYGAQHQNGNQMDKHMFNLEEAIDSWKKELRKSPSLEDGDILELELHLREEIDKGIASGFTEEQAFESAFKVLGNVVDIGLEMHKSRASKPGELPAWHDQSRSLALLTNYWKIGTRNLYKNRIYSLINVLGLVIGIASCLLIGLYIQYHSNYDKHYPDSNELFRLTSTVKSKTGDVTRNLAYTPGLWGPGLVEEYPQFESYARFFRYRADVIVHNPSVDVEFFEGNFYWTENSVFDVFGYQLIQGNISSALSRPNTILISESIAKKYFGDKNPMGMILEYVNGDTVYPLEITGVYKDIPSDSHFHPDFLASLLTISNEWWIQDYDRMDSWQVPFWITYVRMDASKRPLEISEINQFLHLKIGEDSTRFKADIQSVSKIHLFSQLSGEFEDNGDVDYLYGLGTIAAFVLLIACINFMNLSTAKASKRMKEVGLRKVMGSSRKQLIGQFFGESLLMCVLAFVIGVLLTEIVRPILNTFTGDQISYSYLFESWFWYFGLTLVVLIGLLAGSYPALYLSKFQPLEIIRNKFADHTKGQTFRRVLVVGQFSLSVFLLISTLIIFKQLEYLSNKPLGFDKELQIIIPLRGQGLQTNPDMLKERLKTSPKVLDVAYSSNILMKGWHNSSIVLPDYQSSDNTFHWDYLHTDHDFGSSIGIELVEGRFPSREFAEDSSAAILNESAVKVLGMSNDEVLGTRIQNNWGVDGRVVGVAKDFHYATLHENIGPFALMVNYDFGIRFINIKVAADDLPNTIDHIKQQWNDISPNTPFFFDFLDDGIDLLYEREQKQGKLLANFTVMAIIISCLGLFGLVSFMTDRRMKEIGIRKVLGASVMNIVNVLSMDFLKQVIIGFLVGAPIAWYAMNRWLQSFAYRIEINLGSVLLAGGLTLLVAILTVSWQSIKSALMNPVNSLKDE